MGLDEGLGDGLDVRGEAGWCMSGESWPRRPVGSRIPGRRVADGFLG